MSARAARILDRALTRLKLRQLRLLVAVEREGSIQAAAKTLGMSQPAATKMIQDLELDFEVQLFERTNRGVVATAFGKALIRHATLIFAQLSNAAQELDDLSEGNSGRVVVGTLLAASPALLPGAIERLRVARPNVAVKVVEGTLAVLMPRLLAGEIDMVVGRLPGDCHRATLEQEVLFDGQVTLLAGPDHPLVGAGPVSFETLLDQDWILPPQETTLRQQADQFFARMGAAPRIAVESVSYLLNRAMLRRGPLVGLMPGEVAALDVASGLLAEIDWTPPFGASPVGVSYRGVDGLSPAGVAFLDALRVTAADLAIGGSDSAFP
ncbi:LysR substrate-binding domain-containing protein [Jannaschia seohaensis]|uniref:ModE molybdate transport repressor domain-containing protein n=1 Tax=Jannaschia seohaensis TaxID=475081 RepID=A0A2Y9AV81_9RHOB|nr:LysR substrate-binding domain-containing protein [Jannaschia seohaensis]PWJ16968.1 molybdate transport repressor ModE-like protein [Jannaschia seohaensis]SSA48241.1 ModE molybdate transport repressor domain-containing protein [Jannaschia seohaensis]